MGKVNHLCHAQATPRRRRILPRKIIAEMRSARFRPQGGKNGDCQTHEGGIGCRALSLHERQ